MEYEWLPVSDGQLILWFNDFRQNLPKYSASLGLSTEDMMEIDVEYKALAYMIAQIQALRAEVQNRVDYKNLLRDGPESDLTLQFPAGIILAERPDVSVRPGIIPRLVRFVERIKQSNGYTVTIGQELGIEPKGVDQVPTSPQNIVPVTDFGMVRLDFVKATWQGVVVESQRGDETSWTVLGTVFTTPFVDARPPLQPGISEARRYRLRYVDSVDAVGGYSPVVQVILPASPASISPQPAVTLQ